MENVPRIQTPFGQCNYNFPEKSDDYTHVIDLIKNQIEFYLSDSNLIRDNFFLDLIKSNPKGAISLDVFLNCKRIKKQLESLKWCQMDNLKILRKAIKTSQFLKVNSNKSSVYRKPKFDFREIEKTIKSIDERTIYVENLDLKINERDLFKIYQKFGKILKITINKTFKSSNFKSAFVEFEDKDQSNDAICTNNGIPFEMMKMQHVHKKPLRVISKLEWNNMKEKFHRVF